MALYKRKGSPYHWYKFYWNGVEFQGSTKQRNKSAAARVEAEEMMKAKEGAIPGRRKKMTLAEFAPRFLEYIKSAPVSARTKAPIKEGTIRDYQNGWRLLSTQRIARVLIDKISVEDTNFKLSTPDNTSCALRTLSVMVSYAQTLKLISVKPKVQVPIIERHGRRVLSMEEQERLLEVSPQPLRDVLLIMLDMGMRPGKEVFPMRWEHVDFIAKRYFVYSSKTRKGQRRLPISDRVLRALVARCQGQTEGWVFPATRSRTGHLVTVARQWRETKAKAGVHRDVDMYCARHTALTTALMATGDIMATMKFAGHSNVQTMAIYQHRDLAGIGAAMNRKNERVQ